MFRRWFGLSCALLLFVSLAKAASAEEDIPASVTATFFAPVPYIDAEGSVCLSEETDSGKGDNERGRDGETSRLKPETPEVVVAGRVGDGEGMDANDVFFNDGVPPETPGDGVDRPTEFAIYISSSTDGWKILLTAALIGFDESEASLQWQYASRTAPDEWMDAPGATATVYSFTMTPETANRSWRLIAVIKE
ncbi:MAG: hypothetical protein FWG37_04125 [Clostridia bacterium]|nr:hypothetical protein [Clostridia bacterium]